MMMMMMLILVSSLTFQITFGAVPLASISRPFHFCLPFHNTTTRVTLRHKNKYQTPFHLATCLTSNIILAPDTSWSTQSFHGSIL